MEIRSPFVSINCVYVGTFHVEKSVFYFLRIFDALCHCETRLNHSIHYTRHDQGSLQHIQRNLTDGRATVKYLNISTLFQSNVLILFCAESEQLEDFS